MSKLTFDEWLEYGLTNGYCTEEFCSTHDWSPMTSYEMAQFEEGYDACVHVVRLGSPVDWLNE